MENIKQQKLQQNKSGIVWRNIFLIAFILSAIATVVFFAIYKYRQSDDYSKYTEKGCASYDVSLAEDYNPYGEGVPSSNMQYLSSKLEGLYANLYYKLNMKKGEVEYKYTYNLKEVVQVVSKETGKTIISYENQIKTKTVNSVKGEELKIGETHYLDYAYHDAKITEFINQQSDLRTHAVTCTLKLVLEINLKGVCQDFEDDFSKHPTVYISVPLTTDTVSISSGSNITKGEGQIILCKNLSNDKPFLIGAYICAGTAVLTFVLWCVCKKLAMSQDEKFAKAVSKISSNYGSYIQQISKPISQNYKDVVEFNKFIDLLEVSNIIKKPVFEEKKTEKETIYVVPESDTRIYMFKLTKESFSKKTKSNPIVKNEADDSDEFDGNVDPVTAARYDAMPKPEAAVKSSKINRTMELYERQKITRENEYKPVKYDMPKIDEARVQQPVRPLDVKPMPAKPEEVKSEVKEEVKSVATNPIEAKPVQKAAQTKVEIKPAAAKSDASKIEAKASAKATKSETKKNSTAKAVKTTKTATKSSSTTAKQKAKSPTVNLSFDGVDKNKVINVSIETED